MLAHPLDLREKLGLSLGTLGDRPPTWRAPSPH
jgi:hypothetical protein